MAFNFVYPTAAEMTEIEQDLIADDEASRIGTKLFPTENKATLDVRWAQMDNDFGMMHYRGLNGRPAKVQRLGTNIYHYSAGVYGEHAELDEQEYMTRASIMNPTMPIPIGDLVTNMDKQLIARDGNRREYNTWTLLLTGAINIPAPGPNGITIYSDSYTMQTFSPSTPWSNLSASTPLADLQKIQQLYVGHSVDFGAAATIYLNQVDAFHLISNTNTADLFGFKDQYGATITNDLTRVNSFFQGRNLPKIQVNDTGFQTIPVSGPNNTPSTANYQKYISTGLGVVIGARPNGAPVGKWQMTRNSVTNSSTPYSFVKDYFNGVNAPKEIPGRIECHRGFNGGLAIHFPTSIVSLSGL